MAYCIYLRKSRKDLELEKSENYDTLTRHRNTLLELAHKMSLTIGKIYEEVVSGDSIAARPEMQQLLNDVAEGIWEGVLVMEIERLARGDTSDQGIVARTFTYTDTLIITPVKTYNPADEFDQEYLDFELFMSRREYNTIKRRMHAGMISSCKEGNYIHNQPPFGFNRVKNEDCKGFRLEPKPGEAEIVKLIFEWYTKGVLQDDGTYKPIGTSLIANKLNTEYSIKPKSGVWTVPTISSMLRNEHYLGYIVCGKTKREKVFQDGMLVDKWMYHAKGDYDLYPGKHPALVAQEVFDLAQEKLAKNPRRPNKGITNPLAGVIKCGLCGRSMYRRPYQKRGQAASLICQEKTCNNVSSKFDLVEEALLHSIESWVKGYEVQADAGIVDTSTLETKLELLKAEEKQLDELKVQLDRIYESYEKGIYDVEVFLSRQKMTQNKILEAESSIINLNAEIKKERNYIDNQEQIIPRAKKLLSVYRESDDVQLKNDLLKSIFEKVVYVKTANGHYKNQRQDDFELSLFPRLPKRKSE
ncbi:MAG: recombinase family protein [Eubacterium sp.]|nr:recombinase family protein [Eubacterium sp.]